VTLAMTGSPMPDCTTKSLLRDGRPGDAVSGRMMWRILDMQLRTLRFAKTYINTTRAMAQITAIAAWTITAYASDFDVTCKTINGGYGYDITIKNNGSDPATCHWECSWTQSGGHVMLTSMDESLGPGQSRESQIPNGIVPPIISVGSPIVNGCHSP
jgi:hypothetical protein